MTTQPDLKRLIAAEAEGDALTAPSRAVLAFARWRNLTGEAGVKPEEAKLALDRLIDFTEPDAWDGLSAPAPEVGEPLLRDLMRYAITRGLAETKAQLKALEQTPDLSMRSDNPGPAPQRTRRRGRLM
ncbi:MAG: hypothetical protein SGJ17_07545 [Hyphomicrobiales bacterium]|nr:hypothetical protein [Hyphomicrobiales bacterium]